MSLRNRGAGEQKYFRRTKNGFLAEEKGIPAEAQGGAGPLLLGARVNTFATVTDVENYLPQPNAHAAHGRL